MFKVDELKAALVLLRALEERGERRDKQLTRARLSAVTLKRLWGRETITREWLEKVNEWLLSAGWMLIDGGSTYGAVKVTVIENWPRVASKHMKAELEKIKQGAFDFGALHYLLEKQTWKESSNNDRPNRPTNRMRRRK